MLACRGTKWRHIEFEYPASEKRPSITLLPEHLLHFERTRTLAAEVKNARGCMSP